MSITVVTHAWAGKFPQYAAFLKYQIDSLTRCCEECPTNPIDLVICYCVDDDLVTGVVRNCMLAGVTEMHWTTIPLPLAELGRRCIGRNKAAKTSQADFVFFTDVDHLFTPECFRQISWKFDEAGPNTVMIFPKEIKIHRLHSIGDYVTAHEDLPLDQILASENFIPKRYNRAIGGVQIVRGDFARKYGYLADSGWEPTSTPFGDFADDIAFRRQCLGHGPIVPVELDGIYRLRHSRTTYQDKVWTT